MLSFTELCLDALSSTIMKDIGVSDCVLRAFCRSSFSVLSNPRSPSMVSAINSSLESVFELQSSFEQIYSKHPISNDDTGNVI